MTVEEKNKETVKSKVLNLNVVAIVKSEIAWICYEDKDVKPAIKYFLKGNSMPFTMTFDDVKDRDEVCKLMMAAMEE